MTSLIEQCSRKFIQNKIIDQIEDGQVKYMQRRVRDNIQINLNQDDALVDDEQSAISDLDDEELDANLQSIGP